MVGFDIERVGGDAIVKKRLSLVAALLLAIVGPSVQATAAQQVPGPARVTGSVSGAGPDGQAFRIPGVNVRLTLASDLAATLELISDDRGEFTFTDLQPGTYRLQAQLDGFGEFDAAVAVAPGSNVSQDVRLELASVRETVVVTASSSGDLQARQTAPPAEISQQTMQQVPVASEQFQDVLPLVAGVLRGADGLLTVKGARENQNGLRVNNASVGDPVTGEFTFRLPIESVRSMQVVTSAYAPEYGQTTGGMTKIETTAGTNKWKFQAQNLTPAFRRRDGTIRGVEKWIPRMAIGGPLVPGKVTLFSAGEYRFTRTLVRNLPELEADIEEESLSLFTQIDWTASPSDHVSTAIAAFPRKQKYLGLSSFFPQSVATDTHQHGFLWTTTERRVLSPRSVFAAHVSVTQLDTAVGPSVIGPLMVLAPAQNSGSYFNNQMRNTRRYEGFAEYSVTAQSHFVKAGGGVGHNAFNGETESRPVRIVRADRSLAELIDFRGPATLSRDLTDVFAYVQDSWSVADRVTLDFGVRYDRDTAGRDHHLAPRLGFSFVPTADGQTVVRGGIGLFYDKITLNAVNFEQLPVQVATRFGTDGSSIAGQPIVQRPVFDDGRLRNPESVAWNVEVDRALTNQLLFKVGYLQRDGHRELIVDPRADPAAPDTLRLSNAGSSRYKEVELTGRYNRAGSQIVVSYVRSKATGDLNDINSFFANVQNPVFRANEFSRLPSDAPNRLVAWAEIELPGKFGIAPLVEVRDGFPLSIVDENLDFVGDRNRAGRFPRYFSLDLQIWKDVTLPVNHLKARVGLRVFNLTNHFNPRDFDGNLASGRFGGFSNGVNRAFGGKFVLDF